MNKINVGYARLKGSGPKAEQAETEYKAIDKVYAFNADEFSKSTPLSSRENMPITKVRAFPKGTIDTSAKMAGDSLEPYSIPTLGKKIMTFVRKLKKFIK